MCPPALPKGPKWFPPHVSQRAPCESISSRRFTVLKCRPPNSGPSFGGHRWLGCPRATESSTKNRARAVSICALTIPCFNEATRLEMASFATLASQPDFQFIFVDDGSTDATYDVIRRFAACNENITALRQDRNRGKAEAVRRGMNEALRRGAHVVGYLDADLATPIDEVLRLREAMDERDVQVVLATRIRMLGTHIERRVWRHYTGRVFATAASLTLGLGVYDTQCGAKLFRASPLLKAALMRPFVSRWAFDVELLGRLLVGDGSARALSDTDLLEIPLQTWIDVPGSKLGWLAIAQSVLDLARINLELWRRRRLHR
ncbi:glycosyltransferase [Myxococcota bacterium]